jgi:hypothetical protein
MSQQHSSIESCSIIYKILHLIFFFFCQIKKENYKLSESSLYVKVTCHQIWIQEFVDVMACLQFVKLFLTFCYVN